jgi:hypothetical protein
VFPRMAGSSPAMTKTEKADDAVQPAIERGYNRPRRDDA